jgi:uncharacterized membrane protein YhaH (DUF805 family)
MTMRSFFDLWSWNGTVSRRAYLLAGIALTAFKYPIDVLISVAFDQPWGPLMYFTLRVSPLFSHALPRPYLFALAVVSLPFLAAGVSLSARRLRDMGVHPLWCGLLLLPLLHWVFILALVVCPPSRPAAHAPTGGPYRAGRPEPGLPKLVTRVMPESEAKAFLLGLVFSVWLGAACWAIALRVDQTLGGGLFVGTPFGMGFIMGFCVCHGRLRSVWTGAAYGMVPCGVALLVLLVFAFEGIACILMAAVIVLGMSAVGGMAGAMASRAGPEVVAVLGILVAPASVAWDHVHPPAAAPLVAQASIVVHATPEAAFRALASPARYDAPPAPIFAIVAMPLETRADGPELGAGSRARCVFTNGAFVTRVASLDAPREVSFAVEQQPAQLDHILTVDEDRLTVEAGADGTSTLRSEMRYHLRLHPAGYWGLFTNALLGAVHARVLEDVKRRAEHPGREPAGPGPEMPPWMEASNATCPCTRHATADAR